MKKLILTNYGHRFARQIDRANSSEQNEIIKLFREMSMRYRENDLHDGLIAAGICKTVDYHIDNEEIALRYRRNPLENISRIVFEYTTHCNFHCKHCRSGKVKRITETNVDQLKKAVDLFLPLGIDSFCFIGGEVTKYADGWLELVRHMRKQGAQTIAIFSNGWFFEQENFEAAGKQYRDTEQYLRDLEQHGLTHILFSIDGSEALHDQWRGRPGLYRRILNGFSLVKKCGIEPKVSLVIRHSEFPLDYINALEEIADQLYSFSEDSCLIKKWVNKSDPNHIVEINITKIQKIVDDPYNYMSNFIDINNGVQLREAKFILSQIPSDLMRCKAFFRPAPNLSIKASGEVGICPLLNAGEKYGNIHERPLIDILNNLQDNLVFQIHAENKIGKYLKYMDREIFGEFFEHVCSVRTILTLLAKKIEEKNIAPDNHEAIKQINVAVAKITGHLP